MAHSAKSGVKSPKKKSKEIDNTFHFWFGGSLLCGGNLCKKSSDPEARVRNLTVFQGHTAGRHQVAMAFFLGSPKHVRSGRCQRPRCCRSCLCSLTPKSPKQASNSCNRLQAIDPCLSGDDLKPKQHEYREWAQSHFATTWKTITLVGTGESNQKPGFLRWCSIGVLLGEIDGPVR